MTDPIRPDLYAALVAQHGDRVPPLSEVFLRRGWVPLVDRLLTDLAREYPDARIVALTGCGWLHIDYLLPLGAEHDWTRHAALDRFLQRYITESLSTCEGCGSGKGKGRQNRCSLTCDECEERKEACNA